MARDVLTPAPSVHGASAAAPRPAAEPVRPAAAPVPASPMAEPDQVAARLVEASRGGGAPAPGEAAQVAPPAELQSDTRLDIEVAKDGQVIVKVRDAETDKVVREIPPEELIEFGRKLERYLGLLLDKKV